jgi:glutamyl/glutaminyl-tRNA synthetase
MNRHYMKEAAPARIAREALPYLRRAGYVVDAGDSALEYIESLLPIAVGSVDRLEEIPERVSTIFDWDAARAVALLRSEADGGRVVEGFAATVADRGPLDRDSFRLAAARVREMTGLKGRALFHPIRVALTAADSGPELDLAVPAIDRGAAIPADRGLKAIASCARRAADVSRLMRA